MSISNGTYSNLIVPHSTLNGDESLKVIQDEIEWLKKDGSYISDKIKVLSDPFYGRYLISLDKIKEHEEILRIPNIFWFSIHNSLKISKKFQDILEVLKKDKVLNEPQMLLALLLIMEQREENSFWTPMLKTLPEKPPYPLFSKYGTKKHLQSSCISKWNDDFRTELKGQFAHLQQFYGNKYSKYFSHTTLSYETFCGSLFHIQQRAFYLDHNNVIDDWVMIPFMDLFNHNISPSEEHEVLNEVDWRLVSTRNIDKGSEIYVNYGESKSSVDFLMFYGFVWPNNPIDCVRFSLIPSPSYLSTISSSTTPLLDPSYSEDCGCIHANEFHQSKERMLKSLQLYRTTNVFKDGGINNRWLLSLFILSSSHSLFHVFQRLNHPGDIDDEQEKDQEKYEEQRKKDQILWNEHKIKTFKKLRDCLESFISSLPTTLQSDIKFAENNSNDFDERMITLYRSSFKNVIHQSIIKISEWINENSSSNFEKKLTDYEPPKLDLTEEEYEEFHYLISVGIHLDDSENSDIKWSHSDCL